MNKVYIIDYDSVVYIGNDKIVQEINRKRKSVLFTDKAEMLKTLGELIDDKCVENISISISVLEREELDINRLLNGGS